MAETMIWKALATIENEGKKLRVWAGGPADNIYTALRRTKEFIAKEYPKMDTQKIFVNYVILDDFADADQFQEWSMRCKPFEIPEGEEDEEDDLS